MPSISEKLRGLIGKEHPTGWAQRHGFKPQKIKEWLNGSSPQRRSLESLARATGKPIKWWQEDYTPEIMARNGWLNVFEIIKLSNSGHFSLPSSRFKIYAFVKENNLNKRKVERRDRNFGYVTEFQMPEKLAVLIDLFLKNNPEYLDRDDQDDNDTSVKNIEHLSEDLYSLESYTLHELVFMGMSDYPTDVIGWHKLVKEEKWRFFYLDQPGVDFRLENLRFIPPDYFLSLLRLREELRSQQFNQNGNTLELEDDDDDDVDGSLSLHIDYDILTPYSYTGFKNLAFTEVNDEAMFPTLKLGDYVAIDTGVRTYVEDGIYLIKVDTFLQYRRIKIQLNGDYLISSDNPAYRYVETLRKENLGKFSILGLVLPFKFGKFSGTENF